MSYDKGDREIQINLRLKTKTNFERKAEIVNLKTMISEFLQEKGYNPEVFGVDESW